MEINLSLLKVVTQQTLVGQKAWSTTQRNAFVHEWVSGCRRNMYQAKQGRIILKKCEASTGLLARKLFMTMNKPELNDLSRSELPVFVYLRNALRRRCWLAQRGEDESEEWCLHAFEVLTGPTMGTQREVWKAVTKNRVLQRSFSANTSNISEDYRVRSYLDARRGLNRSQNIGGEEHSEESLRIKMTAGLVQDPSSQARAAGKHFDRIRSEELLSGIRRITDPDTNDLVPGAYALTASDLYDFISRWDSSNFMHAIGGAIRMLDFSVYLRFPTCALNVEDLAIGPSEGVKPISLDVTWKRQVRAFSRQATITLEAARQFSRLATSRREATLLLATLQDKYATFSALNPVVIPRADCKLQYKAKFVLGKQSIIGQISPAPGLAMFLAALESDSDPGFVTPVEARLALAQCEVFLTARETIMLGSIIGNSSAPDNLPRNKWSTADILVAIDAAPLPSGVDGKLAVSRWLNEAKSAVLRYLDDGEAAPDDVDILRFMAGHSKIFAAAAIQNVVQESLVKYNRFKRFCCSLEERPQRCRIESKCSGISESSIRYAAQLAGCSSSSFLRQTRINTLADAFPAPALIPPTHASHGRRLCWQTVLRTCTPLLALLAHERSLCNGCVSSDNPKFDRDIVAVCASIAAWIFGDRIVTLCREFEARDREKNGALSVDAFADAFVAAGYKPETFSAEETRWALAVCHHHSEERCVSYAKYLTVLLVGLERAID